MPEIYKYILLSISITFTCGLIGLFINETIKDKQFYTSLSHFNFITNKSITKVIGIGVFKWIVTNTVFKNFNQKLKLHSKSKPEEILSLRQEMTSAEICHLIAFLIIVVLSIILNTIYEHTTFVLTLMLFNIAFHLYPAILQQQNKKRIDQLLKLINLN
jgi:hypothetical protein